MAGNDVSIIIAFSAGALSFLSPCLLPLIPVYLGYLDRVAVGCETGEPVKKPASMPGDDIGMAEEGEEKESVPILPGSGSHSPGPSSTPSLAGKWLDALSLSVKKVRSHGKAVIFQFNLLPTSHRFTESEHEPELD
jgi:hypothetical protein